MTNDEYFEREFNEVEGITAVFISKSCWPGEDYPELEIGKTYDVTHVSVMRSSSYVVLKGFGRKEYNASCFAKFENGVNIDKSFVYDDRFLAPYLRERMYEDINEYNKKDIIIDCLGKIANQYKVKILLAVESGSRAWGFESKNSDWDVRFIYVHKPEWYLKVDEQRDVIEKVFDGDIDMVGWELRKALGLMKKSNMSFMEWMNSPTIYYVDKEFKKRICEVENDYFNPIRAMYHYNHMYNKHNERYLQQEGYPMKKFLYYLRGILACMWIEKYNSQPPVWFRKLVEATVDDNNIKGWIEELIAIKQSGEECDMKVVDEELVKYARHWADYYNERIESFRPELEPVSTEALDKILYDMVMRK